MNRENLNQNEVWDAISGKWALYRARPIPVVADFLSDKKGKILDLACGSGRHFSAFKDSINVELYGIDISKKQIFLAKKKARAQSFKNVDLLIGDASAGLPYDGGFFDSAIFIDALHSIDSSRGRERVVKELFRVLKTGSEALITVWDKHVNISDNREVFKNWNVDGKVFRRYYYLFTKVELLELLENAGFTIMRIFPKNSNTGVKFIDNYFRRSIILTVRKR